MSIWFKKDLTLADLPDLSSRHMSSVLGMQWVELGDDYLTMKMPVDNRTTQPYGLLHGGASCALAETIGSIGSNLVVNADEKLTVGLEINANHIRSVREGWVFARASPVHLGGNTHVWDIRISDKDGRLVCICRLTVAILRK